MLKPELLRVLALTGASATISDMPGDQLTCIRKERQIDPCAFVERFEVAHACRHAITLDELEFKRAVNQTLLITAVSRISSPPGASVSKPDYDPTPEEIWKYVVSGRTK